VRIRRRLEAWSPIFQIQILGFKYSKQCTSSRVFWCGSTGKLKPGAQFSKSKSLVLITPNNAHPLLQITGSCEVPIEQSFAAKFVGSRHCAVEFILQVLKLCEDLNRTFLYILILRTCTNLYGKKNTSTWRLPFAVMLESWPQVCQVKTTFRFVSTKCFVFTKTNSECLVNWISLRICVDSKNIQPQFL